jgi:type IV secretion system protein VirB4
MRSKPISARSQDTVSQRPAPVIHTLNFADLTHDERMAGAEENPCPYYPPGSPALSTRILGSTPFGSIHVADVGHARSARPDRASPR